MVESPALTGTQASPDSPPDPKPLITSIDALLVLEPDILSMLQEYRLQRAVALFEINLGISQRSLAQRLILSRSTLSNRLKGGLTRVQAYESQMNLTHAQKDVLKDWLKVMGRWGLPLTSQTLRDHAARISGHNIGVSWSKKFLQRHPDVKMKHTQSLEECRARSLNATTVSAWFDLLEEIITEFNIPTENMWNMDEKGIQLGQGKTVAALIDRGQKNAYQVQSGSKELVTVIEAICADGTAMPPLVIFKGKRRDLEWQRDNPANASLSLSKNEWTDQELGSLWLEKDFHPFTQKRNTSGRYQLLILDRHNSHCTTRFIDFAKDNDIIILCLPAHTTHALQPCDVGVFSPLSTYWKAEVTKAGLAYIEINKTNLLRYYANARDKAFKLETIKNAFRKCGISPLNCNAISPDLFTPSHTTTTQSNHILPIILPSFLVPIPVAGSLASESATSDRFDGVCPMPSESVDQTSLSLFPPSSPSTSTTTPLSDTAAIMQAPTVATHLFVGLPTLLPVHAPPTAIHRQNQDMRIALSALGDQISRDYAHKILLEDEVHRLRAALAAKKRPPQSNMTTDHTFGQHLTSDEYQLASHNNDVKKRLQPVFKELRAFVEAKEKEKEEEQKQKQKEREDKAEQKKREAEEKQIQAEEKRLQAEEKKRQREREQAWKRAQIDKKRAQAQRKRKEKEVEQAAKKAARALEAARKKLDRAVAKTTRFAATNRGLWSRPRSRAAAAASESSGEEEIVAALAAVDDAESSDSFSTL